MISLSAIITLEANTAELKKATSLAEMANSLFDRLERIRSELAQLDRDAWIAMVVERCSAKERDRAGMWHSDWPREADGKRIITNLHHEHGAPLPEGEFKKRIIEAMAKREAPLWKSLVHLDELLPKCSRKSRASRYPRESERI